MIISHSVIGLVGLNPQSPQAKLVRAEQHTHDASHCFHHHFQNDVHHNLFQSLILFVVTTAVSQWEG